MPVVVADAMDAQAVGEMVRRTKVIATTAGPYATYGSEIVAACAEHGIVDAGRLILLETENSPAAGRHAMQALIENLGRMPRAFMCSSLKMLEGALQQLKLLRGEIDKDILLATFDDHAMLDFLPNRVLSIKQNESALAQQVFERLTESPAERKEGNPCDIVPTELIYRNF